MEDWTKGLARKIVAWNSHDRARRLAGSHCREYHGAESGHHERWAQEKQPENQDSQGQQKASTLSDGPKARWVGMLLHRWHCGRIHRAESNGEMCSCHSRTVRKGSKPLQFLEGRDEVRANFQLNSVGVRVKF